jgi:PAS domain S-box-containing protein
MGVRDDLVALFTADEPSFRADVESFLTAHGLATPRRRAAVETGPAGFDGPAGVDDFAALTRRGRDLVWRVWLLEEVPLGLTLAGPAYQDNPVVYANRTFRRLTGYSLETVRGENLRLLQGPDTDPAAVADLREALSIWEPVTVELRNYTADGRPFTNRLSLVPLADGSGTVAHWLGVQATVDDGD